MPPSPWVRPRSARWNAWLCALAKPGSTTPPSRTSAGAGSTRSRSRRTDRRRPTTGPVPRDRPGSCANGAQNPAVTDPVSGELGQHGGQRVDTGQAVLAFGELGGGVGDSGRVADEQHRGGNPCVGEDPGVVTGSGAEQGSVRQQCAEPVQQTGLEPGRRRPGLLADVRADAGRGRAISATVACTAVSSDPRASSQAVAAEGIAFTPPGVDHGLADRRHAAVGRGGGAGGEHGRGQPDHGVVPVLQPGGAGVVRLAR